MGKRRKARARQPMIRDTDVVYSCASEAILPGFGVVRMALGPEMDSRRSPGEEDVGGPRFSRRVLFGREGTPSLYVSCLSSEEQDNQTRFLVDEGAWLEWLAAGEEE